MRNTPFYLAPFVFGHDSAFDDTCDWIDSKMEA